MKTYEFSLIHRMASKAAQNVKVQIEGETVQKVSEQAVLWLGQNLRSKIQYQWELPGDAMVIAAIGKTAESADRTSVVSNMIAGLIISVREVVAKPATGRVKKAAAVAAVA